MYHHFYFIIIIIKIIVFFRGGGGGGGGGVRKFNIYGGGRFCGYFFGAHVYAFTGVFLSSRYRTGIHFVGI